MGIEQVLLGAQGIQLPDPLDQARKGLSLADLASQYDSRQYLLKAAERKDRAAQVLGQIIPGLQQAGWTPQAIQTAMQHPSLQQYPDVAQDVLSLVDTQRKSDLEAKAKEATALKDTTEARVKAFDQVSSTAFGEAERNPNPDAMSLSRVEALAQFHNLKLPPFSGDRTNPSHVQAYLYSIGKAAYAAKDQVANAEARRKNITEEEQKRGDYQSQAERRTAETEISRGNLEVARQRAQAEGKAVETDEEGNIWIVDKGTGGARQVFSGGGAPGASAPQAGAPTKQINFDRPMTPQEQAAFQADPGAQAPAPGKPLVKGGKTLTESQSKATAFSNQMYAASKVISDLQEKGFKGEGVWQQGDLARAQTEGIPYVPGSAAIPRWTSSDAAQKWSQAELVWTEAALRFLTGANAPEAEVRRNADTYFPRAGDGPAKIAQKAEMRRNMEESVRLATGPGSKKIPAMPSAQSATPAPPKLGEVRDGFRYKGGDPASRASWEPTNEGNR